MLTIISVSYKSKAFLNTNYELVKALNPQTPFEWIVVQNTPEHELDEDLSMDDSRFTMIKGPVLTKQEKESSFYRSIHHAKALNLALAYTGADLILILDPDCFILMPDWIKTISTYMQKKQLVFFGVPYHPKYATHYREFPNAICLFIDRHLMQEKNYFFLDFTPDFEGTRLLNKQQQAAVYYYSSLKKFFKFFFSSTKRYPLNLRDFHLIVSRIIRLKLDKYLSCPIKRIEKKMTRDTGYKIYARYRSRLQYEVTQVYALDRRLLKSKLFDFFLPDRFRFYPRNTSYITKNPSPLFHEVGTWGEQFFWNNKLFAFHLKGVLDDVSNEEKSQIKDLVLRKIERYTQDLLRARLTT